MYPVEDKNKNLSILISHPIDATEC
jgi:hypothetical protein